MIPKSLGAAIVVLRLWKTDYTYEDRQASSRDIHLLLKEAKKLMQADATYFAVEVLGILPSGEYVKPEHIGMVYEEVFPFYVKWVDGEAQERRFCKKSSAYTLYQDLQRQDIQILVTNAHPKRSKHHGK